MKVSMAHLRERSTTGGWISFAVFDAKSTCGDNDGLLSKLTHQARLAGLRVEKSALAYEQAGRILFYGDRDLVQYLAKCGVPRWTHQIDV